MAGPDPVADERERTAETSRRGHVLPLLAVAGVFTVLMYVASVQGHAQFTMAPSDREESVRPLPTPPVPTETPMLPVEPAEDNPFLTVLSIVFGVLLLSAVLAIVYLLVRGLIKFLLAAWRERPPGLRDGVTVDAAVAPGLAIDDAVESEVIRRGIAEAVRMIDTDRTPSDSIVAAWVGLEESAADAGAARASSETPAEFTVRIIGSRNGIADEITTLLGLYERVRFGGYAAAESDRKTALHCLRAIEEGWR